MNSNLRRWARFLLLLMMAGSFAACHFHGPCWPRSIPIRHCR